MLSCTSFLLITNEEISPGQDHDPVVEKIIDLTFYKITRFPQLVIMGHHHGIKGVFVNEVVYFLIYNCCGVKVTAVK